MSQKYTSKDSIVVRKSTLFSLLKDNKFNTQKINQADNTIKSLIKSKKIADSLVVLKNTQLGLKEEEINNYKKQVENLNNVKNISEQLVTAYQEKSSNFEKVIKRKDRQLKLSKRIIVALPAAFLLITWLK